MSTQKKDLNPVTDRTLDTLLIGTFLAGYRGLGDEPIAKPDGPHFIDNDEIMEKLEQDELSAEQRLEIRRHLGRCQRCTEVFGQLVRDGAIAVPNSWVDDMSARTAELNEK